MAARNTSVSLGDHFTDFIDKQVASGRYSSASDVIRTGLRKLEEDEEKLEWLRARIAEGMEDVEKGQLINDSEEFWDEINREVKERVAHGERPNADALS